MHKEAVPSVGGGKFVSISRPICTESIKHENENVPNRPINWPTTSIYNVGLLRMGAKHTVAPNLFIWGPWLPGPPYPTPLCVILLTGSMGGGEENIPLSMGGNLVLLFQIVALPLSVRGRARRNRSRR